MMHELSICQALVAQVEQIAREREAWVRYVHVGLGPLSGVEARLLEDVYPLVCANTRAEGSRLAIKATDVRVRCHVCDAVTVATANRLICGACGDWHTELIAGDEMMLLTVELETHGDVEISHV